MSTSAVKFLPFHPSGVTGPILRRVSTVGSYAVRLWAFSLTLLLLTSFASGASVTLTWDPVKATNLGGYKIHYGLASRNYNSTHDAEMSITAPITGLEEGKTYFFAATAYDTKGNSSGFSNEVSYKVPVVDTDSDGLMDREEIEIYGTDPKRADSDGDGLSDGDEIQVYDTDPTRKDTDGDGASDGEEVSKGTPPGIPDPEPAPPAEVVFAVNAGGAQYTDATGLVYQADSRFSGGNTSGTTAPIAGTTDDPLYQKVRFGNFSYAIPLAEGDYLVTLKFAETYFTNPGQRVFDVAIEGVDVINDLDLVAEAGPKTAYDLTFPVHVADGVLDINFRSAVNYALVNAIVVIGGTGN